jgi:hypothetical protein
MTMRQDEQTPESGNATREEIEALNGLVIRTLIRKIENEEATATDIGNAVKLIVSNRVQPKEPGGYLDHIRRYPEAELDFPFEVD